MPQLSGKYPHELYNYMLSEAMINARPEAIAFGAVALAFLKGAMERMHLEQLFFFHSVELLMTAHAAVHSRGSPMTEERPETLYRHFEAAISLTTTFDMCTKDDSLLLYSAKHWLLPLIK